MKCRNCSKDIPDGFADCPWCGESQRATPTGTASIAQTALPLPTGGLRSSSNVPLVWLSLCLSLVLVPGAAYAATMHKFGFLSWQDAGYFIGACTGPFLAAALIVFAYYSLRHRTVPFVTKLLPISCGASLFALLTLLGASGSPRSLPDPALVSPSKISTSKVIPRTPHVATPWDPAIISLYTDLKNSNDAYVAEVSRLDATAHPWLTPESFRSAASMQTILTELHARLAVAEKFTSPEPMLSKMKGYVAAINASDDDKREFLAGFMPGIEQSVAHRTAASGYERDWLNACIAAYEFMLKNSAAYTIDADGHSATFRNAAALQTFKARMQRAYELKAKFLQENGAYLASQSAAREKAGMEP